MSYGTPKMCPRFQKCEDPTAAEKCLSEDRRLGVTTHQSGGRHADLADLHNKEATIAFFAGRTGDTPAITKRNIMEMIAAGLYPGGRNFPGYPGGDGAADADGDDNDNGEGPDVLDLAGEVQNGSIRRTCPLSVGATPRSGDTNPSPP